MTAMRWKNSSSCSISWQRLNRQHEKSHWGNRLWMLDAIEKFPNRWIECQNCTTEWEKKNAHIQTMLTHEYTTNTQCIHFFFCNAAFFPWFISPVFSSLLYSHAVAHQHLPLRRHCCSSNGIRCTPNVFSALSRLWPSTHRLRLPKIQSSHENSNLLEAKCAFICI